MNDFFLCSTNSLLINIKIIINLIFYNFFNLCVHEILIITTSSGLPKTLSDMPRTSFELWKSVGEDVN